MPLGLDVHRKRWADVADEMSDEETSEEEDEEQDNTDRSRRSWSVSTTTKTSPPKGAIETLGTPERVPEPYDSSFDEFLTTWVPPPAKPKTRTKIKIKKDGSSTVVQSQTRHQDVSVVEERYDSYELYNQSLLKTKQTAVPSKAVSSEAVKS